MIRRVVALLLLAWALGFVAFYLMLGRPLDAARKTDAIVVLTGGPGRIDRGVQLLRDDASEHMLVSGVGREVKPRELAVEYRIEPRLMACCIDLGHQAVDTRSNADETAEWVRRHQYKTVRLVTADWHMARARLELAHMLGSDLEVLGDAVPSKPKFVTLLREYHKFLVRAVAILVGAG
ncbi:YdcF family protein [Sphingomonas sp.]|uniref:YdcF family protein n=1 Tax=Sphingomonas sp. TaxID=28214 RepID=UPI001B22D3CD|nr:YdcF family protein [Sphingomonas sp.]MBO9714238.1 YdcF family protein [Sphingomonas sp.]